MRKIPRYVVQKGWGEGCHVLRGRVAVWWRRAKAGKRGAVALPP
jgi:hypothetical protein